jgi:D-alanine-D-alanine ligase
VDGTELAIEAWRADPAGSLAAALGRHPFPVYVKPASLGSSIGVSRCASREEAEAALELAFELDTRVLIETGIDGGREVNCAVLGPRGGELRASVCEQPVSAGDLLSFEDKYLHGAKTEGMKGAERIIPAPIDAATTARVQELATRAFAALGCAGVARVDFLIGADGTVYVNELNTIPGSFSFYLWEPVDVHFPDLLDAVLGYALAEHERGRSVTRTFPSTLLSEGRGGAKTG